MPQYKTHARFNILLVLPIIDAGLIYALHPAFGFLLTFSLSYAYATLYMNPDVDLAYQIKLFSLKGLLTLPFRGYAHFFRHRGLSHSILFGTLTRIAWLLLISIAVLYGGNYLFLAKKHFSWLLKEYQPYLLYGIAGVFFADLFHILLDKVSPRSA